MRNQRKTTLGQVTVMESIVNAAMETIYALSDKGIEHSYARAIRENAALCKELPEDRGIYFRNRYFYESTTSRCQPPHIDMVTVILEVMEKEEKLVSEKELAHSYLTRVLTYGSTEADYRALMPAEVYNATSFSRTPKWADGSPLSLAESKCSEFQEQNRKYSNMILDRLTRNLIQAA